MFVWEGVNINSWSQSCFRCQRSKVQSHFKNPPEQILVYGKRFSNIHEDLVGPLPQFCGYTLILTIIIIAYRWSEQIPLQSTTAEECVKVLLCTWIPIFGVSAVITSDREAKFISSIWNSLYRFLGKIHLPTTSFHHQSNGLVERFYPLLKVSLRAPLSGTDWFHHLSLVLVGLRSVPREDSAMSASEALFGSPLIHNQDFHFKSVANKVLFEILDGRY